MSEFLTSRKEQKNNECKSKDMIIAKLSRTIENVTSKKIQVMSSDVKANSNPHAKESPLWDIMSELSSGLDSI